MFNLKTAAVSASLVATTVATVALSAVSPAFAQAPTPGPKVTQDCQNASDHINSVITRALDTQQTKETKYMAAVTKVQNFIAQLQSENVDPTKIQAIQKATQDMNQALLTRANDHATMITDLKTAQQFVCGDSQGQFRSALQTAKAQAQVVKTDTQAIRNIWQTEVRPIVLTLRHVKPSPTPAAL